MLVTAKEHNTTPRITILASDAHYFTELDDEVLKSDSILEKMSAKEYCTKKYASLPTINAVLNQWS